MNYQDALNFIDIEIGIEPDNRAVKYVYVNYHEHNYMLIYLEPKRYTEVETSRYMQQRSTEIDRSFIDYYCYYTRIKNQFIYPDRLLMLGITPVVVYC